MCDVIGVAGCVSDVNCFLNGFRCLCLPRVPRLPQEQKKDDATAFCLVFIVGVVVVVGAVGIICIVIGFTLFSLLLRLIVISLTQNKSNTPTTPMNTRCTAGPHMEAIDVDAAEAGHADLYVDMNVLGCFCVSVGCVSDALESRLVVCRMVRSLGWMCVGCFGCLGGLCV